MFALDITSFPDVLLLFTQTIGIFLIFRAFTIQAQVSEFDDLAYMNIILTFGVVTMIRLYQIDFFPERGIREIIPLLLLFYTGIAITSYASNIRQKKIAANQNFRELIQLDSARNFILLATLAVFIVFGGWFSLIQLQSDSPDARLVTAENNRIFDILRTGSQIIFTNIFFICWITKKNNFLRVLFIAFILVALTSGSKSIILSLAINYMLLRGFLRGGLNTIEDIKLFLPIAIVGLSVAFLTIVFYVGNAQEAFMRMVSRIMLSGDIYLFSYVFDDYRNYADIYNPALYILHPFLRLIGSIGYEQPLGSMMFNNVFGGLEGFGPNVHFTVLSLVFANGNIWGAGMLCFAAGSCIVLLKNLSFKILQSTHSKIPPIWRIIAFVAIFPCAPILVDIGLYQQSLITIGVVAVLLFCGYEFLRGRYITKLANYKDA